jgi:predicted lipoprotein with Yx(FWY)xxD motif
LGLSREDADRVASSQGTWSTVNADALANSLKATSIAGSMMPVSVKISSGILTDSKGMTLYTWDRDKEPNVSLCTTNCQGLPLAANLKESDSGHWKIITRSDGAKQWAYKGKPLYYYKEDKAPDEKVGDGKGTVWHIARP